MSEQWIGGLHAVKALITQEKREVIKLVVSQERADAKLQEILQEALARGIPIQKLDIKSLNQRFGELNHQGVIAIAKALKTYDEKDLGYLLSQCQSPPLILILDAITDPHNLGACLRTADASGVDFVVIPKDKSVAVTATVSKVACGAAETVPLVRVTNLARAIESLKAEGVWLYGAAGEASKTVYQLDLKTPVGIVLGAEGAGLRRLTRAHCDEVFSIPMVGTVESLNVSVATGISLYEAFRQRRFNI